MVRSGGPNLSFDVLATTTFEENDTNTSISRSKSDPLALETTVALPDSPKRNRRKRRNKSSKKKAASDGLDETNGDKFDSTSSVSKNVVYEEMSVPEEKSVVSIEFRNLHGGVLRQRSLSLREENENENENENFSGDSKKVDGVIGDVRSLKLEREESLDWKRIMLQKDPNCEFS